MAQEYACTCKAAQKAMVGKGSSSSAIIPTTYYPWILAGGVAGSVYMSWRNHLSLKMNLLSFIYDRLALFPHSVHALTEKESMVIVQKCRANWKMAEIFPKFEGPWMAKTLEMNFPSREAKRLIQVRIYRPKTTSLTASLPVIVFCHGGGFAFGSVQSHDSLARDISQRSGCVLVSVEYRLAPEHKFPCGIEDCEDALLWVSKGPKEIIERMGGDCSKLAVCGDSAGGTMCANLAVFAKRNQIQLALQCLLYPSTSAYGLPFWRDPPLPKPTDSAVLFSAGPLLHHNPVVWVTDLYLKSPDDMKDPRAVPILYTQEDLIGVAPAFVTVAGCDMLRDDGIEYAKKLERAGVPTKLRVYENTVHAFYSLHFCEHNSVGLQELGDAIQEAFNTKALKARM